MRDTDLNMPESLDLPARYYPGDFDLILGGFSILSADTYVFNSARINRRKHGVPLTDQVRFCKRLFEVYR
jgi:hypothetical protein